VLAENFWLLVLAPLAIGAITLGIVSFLPKTYESLAVLSPAGLFSQRDQFHDNSKTYDESDVRNLGAMMTARLTSPDLQFSAAEKQSWIRRQQLDRIQTQKLVKRAVDVQSDQKSGLIKLTTRAPSASEAQNLAQAIIDGFTSSITPRGAEFERLQKDIDITSRNLADTTSVIEAMTAEGGKTGRSNQISMTSLADLLLQKGANERRLLLLQIMSKPDIEKILIQAPTLDENPVRPKRLQITAVAIILSGLVLFIVVFVRAAFRAVVDNPEGADKITRIRKGILRR